MILWVMLLQMLTTEHARIRWMYAGITLVVAIAYTFLLKIAAFPLILTIMVSIWVMLLCSCGILILKAGYIDAKSIPGSDFAATRMPEVKQTTHVDICIRVPLSVHVRTQVSNFTGTICRA